MYDGFYAVVPSVLSGRRRNMRKNAVFKSWSARQAEAILAVVNIKISGSGRDVLRHYDEGHISYDEAKDEILRMARLKLARTGG